ncbi:protein-tyrosine phosphatase [Metarhizium rileyi]|uniref:Protein-tyrosine phosphatase n=1 Tax=Metarhizium rileyi (strain RCEF 4871) TaxID=1649241 RepID=A0A167F3G8_METRR|nr:protein-tyrosine phosphatase [Metarhizium rileyi RCEF 4871]
MLLKKVFLVLVGAAAAIPANPRSNGGYEYMDGAGTSKQGPAKGGLQRFEFVSAHMAPGDRLARSSAPYYYNNDTDQRITPETIAALRENGITHVISLNQEAESEEVKKALADAGIAYTPLPVVDYTNPTPEGFQRAWDRFVQNRAGGTLVWCGYGYGRTGTMITALQMYAEHERGQLHHWTRDDYLQNHVEKGVQEAALDDLQRRLRSRPAGLSDYENTSLMAGEFSRLACPAVLAIVLVHIQMNMNSAALRRRLDIGTPATGDSKRGDCERARDLLQRQHVPEPCQRVTKIEFGLTLSNDYSSGTYDDIAGTLEGPAGKAHFFIAAAPSRGTQKWTPVDLKEAFGSDVIDIASVDKITLTAWGTVGLLPLINKLRAQCADPDFATNDDKLVGINAWYGHPGGWFLEPLKEKTVATFPITAKDWSFAPPCVNIGSLSYDFRIGDTSGGGTWDTLTLSLGGGKKIPLGASVAAGFAKSDEINLRETFGKDVIDVRDLKEVTIGDDLGSSILSGDWWTFQGVTFSATCADVRRRMQMKKFGSVNEEVRHKDNAPAWRGDIVPKDWLEVA